MNVRRYFVALGLMAFLLMAASSCGGKSSGTNGNGGLGTFLGTCDFTNSNGVCEDFYSGKVPAYQSGAAVASYCASQTGFTPPPTSSETAPCTATNRSGSCTILYTEEVVRYYTPQTTTSSGQLQCSHLGTGLPGGATFTAN